MKKALSVIGNILITIIVIFSVLMTTMVIISTKSEVGMPNLFGKALFFVQTDSMKGDKGFDVGSLIVVDILNKEECDNLKVGDVITFWRTYDNQKFLETHRIVDDKYTPYTHELDEGVLVHGGQRFYATRGDNTPDIDLLPDNSGPEYSTVDNIVGVWTGTAIPRLGSILKFLQSQLGFLICIVVPMVIFFLFELYKFIATLMDNKKKKAVAAGSDAEDEIKQKAIAEYLAKQEAEKALAANQPADNPVPPAEETAPASENIDEN